MGKVGEWISRAAGKVGRWFVRFGQSWLPTIVGILLSFTPLGPMAGAMIAAGLSAALNGGSWKDVFTAVAMGGISGATMAGLAQTEVGLFLGEVTSRIRSTAAAALQRAFSVVSDYADRAMAFVSSLGDRIGQSRGTSQTVSKRSVIPSCGVGRASRLCARLDGGEEDEGWRAGWSTTGGRDAS